MGDEYPRVHPLPGPGREPVADGGASEGMDRDFHPYNTVLIEEDVFPFIQHVPTVHVDPPVEDSLSTAPIRAMIKVFPKTLG